MPTSYTRTPDGEIPVYLSVDWTAPEFKNLNLTTAAGFMAWVRAKLDELKFKRESWSDQREPGNKIGIEADAFSALQTIPEIRAYTTRTAAEFHERHLKTTIAPLTQFEAVLPELEDCIADLAAGQELDPDLAGDTVLSTLIATLGEACKELREGVQQLKHITLPGRARWVGADRYDTIPLYQVAYVRLNDCIWGLEAYLSRTAANSPLQVPSGPIQERTTNGLDDDSPDDKDKHHVKSGVIGGGQLLDATPMSKQAV